MKVVKRDNSLQDFDFDKIKDVVIKAFNSVNQDAPDKFISQLESSINNLFKQNDTINVEDIQSCIQKELIKRNKYDVVESFIIYRNKRTEAREKKSDLIKSISRKLNGSNIENQNANLDEASFGGRLGEASRVVAKNDALKYRMSKKSRKNHENNEIYIHDMDSYSVGMHNCLSDPIDNALANGFKTRQTDVRPAGSVSTAMQLVAVKFQLQSLQQFGGVSATHIDWSMVPYVRKSFYKHYKDGLKYVEKVNDTEIQNILSKITYETSIESEHYKKYDRAYEYSLDMTKREVHQAVEGMFHNLNTLQSRSGCQLPFSSINFGTCTYPEGRMVTEEILNVSIEGLGGYGKTSIFPCSIFQYMKGVNDKPGTPNYDLYKLALRSTSQRLYPNYVNCQWTNQKEWVAYDRKLKNDVINNLSKDDYAKLVSIISTDRDTADCLDLYLDNENRIIIKTEEHPVEIASTMGCRTVNGADINFREVYEKNINNVLNGRSIDKTFRSAAQKDGRGNICPVTIILPTIAMIAKSKSEKKNSDIITEFFELLDKKISEAKDTLIERFNHICSQPAEAAKFMWENNTMVGYVENEGPISAIKHGTLVIGQLGLAETLQILIGCDHTDEKGMELAERIESLFANRCKEYKETYKLNFGVYYTPAENLCYTAMKKFKSTYGVIPNVSDKEYFTNSMHVPVWKNINPFEKIDIESRLTGYSNAGCITYVELPSTTKHNIEALETIVNYAMDKDIPYFAINIPVDTCQNCMYIDEINDVCPKCGSDNILKLRRVTGYLSSDYRNFNKGKQAEVNQRTKHIQN